MLPVVEDLRSAGRMLRKSPGFAAIAILTLAVAIAANTALFSVVNGVLLNPLPYPSSGQLAALYEKTPGGTREPVSYLNFLDWQRQSRAFAAMAIYRNEGYDLTGMGAAERLRGFMTSADFFRTLGIDPCAGRTFLPGDDRPGAPPVAILGGGFWKRRFGGSTAILGTSIELNGTAYTVVGVMPAKFSFYGEDRDVYTPIGQWRDPSFRDRRVEMSARVVGRVARGTSMARAEADLEGVARNL